jgi:L-threonylcarbamoyladenylate synthase
MFRAHETCQSTNFEATHWRRPHWFHPPPRKTHVLARWTHCLRWLRGLPARLQVLVVSPNLVGHRVALSTVSRYLIRAGTVFTPGYAVLTASLLIRVKPVPITIIPPAARRRLEGDIKLQTRELGGTSTPRRPVLRQAALPSLNILSAELNWAKRLRAKTLRTARRALPNISWSRAFRALPSRRNHFRMDTLCECAPAVEATSEGISQAADVLRRGGLVAFPTETVYGLGAAVFNRNAVARIFEVKGRPADNPLIVHVSSRATLDGVVRDVPDTAGHLMDAFWPGPLTLVLHRSRRVPSIVSAGLDTVAVRVPADPVALQLIRLTGQPVAAPSANRSGRPSPTIAEHVVRDLGSMVDLVIDGGPTQFGVESTVVDVTGAVPVLLRPGGVSREEIERVIGCSLSPAPASGPMRSPGTRHQHYAPTCRVIPVDPYGWEEALQKVRQAGGQIGVVAQTTPVLLPETVAYYRNIPGDATEYARHLFAAFREAEDAGVDVLLVETVQETGVGLAVMDRLRRAATSKDVPVYPEEAIRVNRSGP